MRVEATYNKGLEKLIATGKDEPQPVKKGGYTAVEQAQGFGVLANQAKPTAPCSLSIEVWAKYGLQSAINALEAENK
jgi:hypothetical protein